MTLERRAVARRGYLPTVQQVATPILLVLPLLIGLLVALLVPLAILVLRSLSVPTQQGWTLASYADVLGDSRFWRLLAQTALVAVASTVGALLLGVPAAVYLEQQPSPARRVLAVLLTIPLSLPGIIIGFFVILFWGRTGVVTETLEALIGRRVPPLAYTFWGLLLGYIYFQIPRVVLTVRGAAAALDPDTLAVARTLGATPLRVYTAVILPVLRPALLSAASLSMATAFGAFGTAATLSRAYRVLPLDVAAAFTERFAPERAATLSILLIMATTICLQGLRVAANRGRTHEE